MLDQALKFRLAFEKMEAEDKPYNDYFAEKEDGNKRIGPAVTKDWENVDRLVQILEIFYKSTLVLSASNYVASHKLYNEIVSITINLGALTYDDDGLKDKAEAMLAKLAKYRDAFGEKVEFNRLVIVASVFDPRKKMKFAELCFERLYGQGSTKATQLQDSVYNILSDLFDEYTRNNLLNKSSTGTTGSSTQSEWSQDQVVNEDSERPVLRNGFLYENMKYEFDEIVKETGLHNTANEVDRYLKEPVEKPIILKGTEYDLLNFWRINNGKYPVLSLIAKDILAMQVTFVASESAFSTSGRVVNPFRSCLSHYMVEVLMCLEQWLKCEIHLNERGVSTIKQLLSEITLEDHLMRSKFRFSSLFLVITS